MFLIVMLLASMVNMTVGSRCVLNPKKVACEGNITTIPRLPPGVETM